MSLYQTGQSVTFSMPVTQTLQQELAFPAKSLIVDNHSNQYLYVPNSLRYVAPNALGVVLGYSESSRLTILVQAPPGVTQQAPIPAQTATITAVESELPPSYGAFSALDAVINGGTVNANITNSSLEVNANITNAAIDANITNSSLEVNANITNATLNANITNATIDANITNATISTDSTIVHTMISGIISGDNIFPAGGTGTDLGWGGNPIAGWSLCSLSATSTLIEIRTGALGGPYTIIWVGPLAQYVQSIIFMPSGIAIPGGTAINIYNFGSSSLEISYNFYSTK